MGLSKILSNIDIDGNESVSSERDNLQLSHAIQRLMFWAEAGRNAYKDDGRSQIIFSDLSSIDQLLGI